MKELKLIALQAKQIVDEPFRRGEAKADFAPYILRSDLGRVIDLEPLESVIGEATSRESASPDKSDAWLSPRVHATLRLTRREAADKRIWNYLSLVAFPTYVRWRFPFKDKGATLDRFVGEDSKHALARLWWGAELTRNGNDYTLTGEAFRATDIGIFWQGLDLFHHRPAALAAVRFLARFNGDKRATNEQSKKLSKALNMMLTTVCLDSIAQNPQVDAEAYREWCEEAVDETKMLEKLPIGPDEDPIQEQSIQAVEQLLDRLAEEIDMKSIRGRKPEVSPATGADTSKAPEKRETA